MLKSYDTATDVTKKDIAVQEKSMGKSWEQLDMWMFMSF